MNSKKRIAVIGAGVCGTTAAFRLQEQFGDAVSITIFADKFSPNTTGDVSAGLWGPFLLSDTPQEKIRKWSKDTHIFFHKLWRSGDAAEAGVSLLTATRVTTDSKELSTLYDDIVYGCTKLDEKTLSRLSKQYKRNYKCGIQCTTFTCEPSSLLPYLYKRIVEAGGCIEQKLIESFRELDDFDIVINCAGLGARLLTKGDAAVKPIRGQVMRVKAPWAFGVILEDDDDGNYIIPNMHTVILGGTHQENDYNTNVDVDDRKFIREGCYRLMPSMRQAEIANEMVGLRPGRSEVRLKYDTFTTKSGKLLHIVHNYGHGGAGVTLSYGCAIDVANIVSKIMTNGNLLPSKL